MDQVGRHRVLPGKVSGSSGFGGEGDLDKGEREWAPLSSVGWHLSSFLLKKC